VRIIDMQLLHNSWQPRHLTGHIAVGH
jgi:hypothetical protein